MWSSGAQCGCILFVAAIRRGGFSSEGEMTPAWCTMNFFLNLRFTARRTMSELSSIYQSESQKLSARYRGKAPEHLLSAMNCKVDLHFVHDIRVLVINDSVKFYGGHIFIAFGI